MKKLIIASAMAFGVLTVSAQTKIGYINTEELMGSMPEAAKADQELQQFQQDLAKQGQDMMRDLTIKDSLYVLDSAKLSPSMKEIKRNELISLYQRVQNWQSQGQELYQNEAQKKIAPIRDKALAAIRTVAKENGYTHVLDINSVIIAPPGDDLLVKVKKHLGIKEAAPAPGK